MNVRRIEVLDPLLANKIAAGEVVERPASVVKELVENALDAGASAVTAEIRDGGVDYIRVTDNGCGIDSEYVKTAFLRHATSKLHSVEGLDGIETLGFRGEALASIAAVAHVNMRTRTEYEEAGTSISIDGGTVSEVLPCGCPAGTNIEVRELFYNVPARLKFLKSPRAEAAAVGDYMLRLILGNTDVSFKFISNGKPVYHSAGDGSLENAIICVYGSEIAEHIRPVRYDDGYVLIEGFCGDEYAAKSTRTQQSFFINGRYIRSQQLSFAAQRAYETRLMVGRFPFIVLRIKISPREVDVNVHPNKLAVRFRDEDRIASAVMLAVRNALHDERTEITVDTPVSEPENKPSMSDVYSVFRNEGTKDPDTFVPVPPAPKYERNEPVFLRDSGSSAPASEVVDLNGVMHYSFAPVQKNEEIKSEEISFGLHPFRIIGAAFNTYVIVEQGDSIFYIDQHAAHERINYEKVIKNELRFESQILLTAKVITLSPTDHQCLLENIERFRELGFEIEEFGALSVSVHAVPNGIKNESTEKLIHDMIGIIRAKGSVSELDILRGELIQYSCKHAVKAGQELDMRQIEDILSHYSDGSTPLTCPHGRPVMVSVSKRDFEKMFKRIQ